MNKKEKVIQQSLYNTNELKHRLITEKNRLESVGAFLEAKSLGRIIGELEHWQLVRSRKYKL